MAGQLIDDAVMNFIHEIDLRLGILRTQWKRRYGRPYEFSDSVKNQLLLCKELVQRRGKVGPKATMTESERMQVQSLAKWLLDEWHDFNGTPARPQAMPTASGFGFFHEVKPQ